MNFMKLRMKQRRDCRDHEPRLVHSTTSLFAPHETRRLYRCNRCRVYLGVKVDFPGRIVTSPLIPDDWEPDPVAA